MNKLTAEKRAQVVGCLVEGMSIRATVRITGVAKNTITKLGLELGNACIEYQDKMLVNLPCKKIQCDEIWSFCYAKEKNVPADHKGEFGYGDIYTWTAICAETKLILSFLVGRRDAKHANAFMLDLAARLKNRVQLSTDGYKVYLNAVDDAFGGDIDYAMLVKTFGNPQSTTDQRRYSPADCTGIEKLPVCGNPDKKDISTSYVERQNLTMRMSMRRFTRLTNGFSKKIENLEAAVALYFMYYNFCRVHQTLRVTPAMEAKITDHVWTLEEIINLLN
jgi:IS1 family transposase